MEQEFWQGAKQPPNEFCPALVSLVFLHTFFGLAQFCKKTIQPGFQCFQFLKSFALQAQESSHNFPCRKCDTNH
jgi:hypothetical protein